MFPLSASPPEILLSYPFVPVLSLPRIRYASSRWSQSFIYIFLCMSSIWYASIPSVIHPQKSVHSLIDNQTVKHIQFSTNSSVLVGLIQPFAQPTVSNFLRKEVIQPHLPIRLPCYDFTPVIGPAFGSSFFAVRSLTSGVTDSHGVTGGVYKTRERIHRGILIRDY